MEYHQVSTTLKLIFGLSLIFTCKCFFLIFVRLLVSFRWAFVTCLWRRSSGRRRRERSRWWTKSLLFSSGRNSLLAMGSSIIRWAAVVSQLFLLYLNVPDSVEKKWSKRDSNMVFSSGPEFSIVNEKFHHYRWGAIVDWWTGFKKVTKERE